MDTGMLGLASSAMEVTSHRAYRLVTHCITFSLEMLQCWELEKFPVRENAHTDGATETVTFHTTYRVLLCYAVQS